MEPERTYHKLQQERKQRVLSSLSIHDPTRIAAERRTVVQNMFRIADSDELRHCEELSGEKGEKGGTSDDSDSDTSDWERELDDDPEVLG